MTSISMRASLGRPAAATVDRAGAGDAKYVAYTSFIAAKSFMSARNTVVLTTRSKLVPAAARMALTLSKTLARLGGDVAVDERAGRRVERNLSGAEKQRPARMACEYGPDGFRRPVGRDRLSHGWSDLGGLDDLARPQAARADADAAHSAVHHRPHGLQVGLEPARAARCGRG